MAPNLINRRLFLAGTVVWLTAPLVARAEQASKTYRIGVLEIVSESANVANLRAFRQGLAKLGYVEGHHFAIEYRSADGRADRLPDLASDLARLRVDVIVTGGTPAALAARGASRTIPIVMAWSGNPVAEGVVASLALPGGNVTGLHVLEPAEIGGRRLQLLRETIPGLSRVGVLFNPTTHAALVVRETEKVASAMGVQVQKFEVWGEESFERTFEAVALGQIDSLITVEDYVTLAHRTQIVHFTGMSRLPAIHGLREFADAGGLMAYGTEREDLFRRSATYVHKILKGAKPADLPVQQPERFELVINLKTAKALALTIPQSVLVRADRVIE